ncbi:hypothetical protein C1646_696675 [Rhizophagus diaphanus]|nr:hypothetical protein C1646_696675 [Rhizophagus diaphanus] [Rhizophagus sp. MUCL 43196]
MFLILLRLLQCFGSLITIIIEILRHTGSIINLKKVIPNNYELFFEYCVMNLGFVLSALYLFQLNQRRKQGPYKLHIFVDCVLMNAWMIFGILRLSPQFDMSNILTCNQYQFKQREGCITYISTLVLGYIISGSYFLTAIISTWLWMEQKNSQPNFISISNPNPNPNPNPNSNFNLNFNSNSNSNFNSIPNHNLNHYRNHNCFSNFNSNINSNPINSNLISSLDSTKLSGTKNINVAINQDDIEFNRPDGTIVVFRKPSPSFLKHERFSDNSSNNSYISEYSLGSSFSRTYGSIIIPRKYSDDSNIIGRNQIVSTHSENSINSKRLSSSFSDKTSRSSNYDGSIIIKLVT